MTHCRFTNPSAPAKYAEYCDNVQIDSKYLAIHDGQIVSIINPKLAATRNLTDETLADIAKLHVTRYLTCKAAEALSGESSPELTALFESFIANESALQELWGFPIDGTYHEWYEFPHCTCPKMDNKERRGTKYQVFTVGCPIHTPSISIV